MGFTPLFPCRPREPGPGACPGEAGLGFGAVGTRWGGGGHGSPVGPGAEQGTGAAAGAASPVGGGVQAAPAPAPTPGRQRSPGAAAAPELPRWFLAGPARDGPAGAAPGATLAPRKNTRRTHEGPSLKEGGEAAQKHCPGWLSCRNEGLRSSSSADKGSRQFSFAPLLVWTRITARASQWHPPRWVGRVSAPMLGAAEVPVGDEVASGMLLAPGALRAALLPAAGLPRAN